MNKTTLQEIAVLANNWYKYLPDNLRNKSYLNELLIDIQRSIKSLGNKIAYVELVKGLGEYIEDVEVDSISGRIEATPLSGNAPLNSTLRARVEDPSGTQILSGNHTWWIDVAGKRVVIGRGPSINYTFKEEWKYSVFLDVTSSHKNALGNTDVLPYRERIDISVNEKIASVIINVNSDRVSNDDELKFTPEDANYGLLFDATSSTPTDGTRFSRTEWNFGNGIRKSYNGSPKIERIRYANEWDYEVSFKLTTNEGKVIENNFTVYIRNPIAKIEVNREDGYIWDKFTFAAKSSGFYRDLRYSWEIVDIDNDTIIHQVSDKIMTYVFTNKGKFNVRLTTRRSSWEVDQDTRIIYVTSQSPIAEFETKIPFSHKPNRVFFDASRSFDPDFSDDGNLTYNWFINGDRVTLEESSANGSIGYYVFDSVGTQSISLEVTDPDGLTTIKKWTVNISSTLSVDMFAFPRVIARENFIKFTAESPQAQVFEWDFGDWKTQWGAVDKVTHTYDRSGSFNVTLKVTDKDNNVNTYSRKVYVSESDRPLAFIDVWFWNLQRPQFQENVCDWAWAYIVNRVQTIKLDGSESINIDGKASWLEYSWKIWNDKYSEASSVSQRFDEIWCFPVKLTVKSRSNGETHSVETMVKVENALPTLSSLWVVVENSEEDPLIVRVSALWASDPDGVIQSYLWYYYTDVDTQPQDFRSTLWSSTTFVIPKITWNYYFVAILKDNNEARVTSEEITGSRYFTTITWDNINTPIVELSVNDNSAVIWDEIVFSAGAQNILGQSVVKDSTFSWDFDGDGFYDTQTTDPTTTYKYKKSGEFYAKVKVKHKGISSTKNITINVSNKLVADFGYISIGNKFIFFDTSAGSVDARSWDLWDGNKKSGTYFEHTYTDGKSSHDVKLTISEGSTSKNIIKKATKNVKNILLSRGKTLSLFTYPVMDEDGKIVLDNQSQDVFVYLWESDASVVNYAIDYDTQQDSDLNGWNDDDEDNKWTSSYISWDVIQIPLNEFMKQWVRVFVKDEDGVVLASKDIEIEKTYIEEQNIDPSLIIFDDVTESEKEKIEELKKILMQLPQQERLMSLNYIQKLQENWNDDTEKTRTILDFENYIFELSLDNEDEFIGILESLLVEWQEDQSAKQITYQALMNLVPSDIQCESQEGTCYESIITKLTQIRESSDVEFNKAAGEEILEVIGASNLLTSQQKLDFKAILKSLVYRWDISAIPEDEKQEVIDETPAGDSNFWENRVAWILIFLWKILMWVILGFFIIILWFYIFYLFTWKKKGQSFTEFISGTTTFSNNNKAESQQEDIFADLDKEEKLIPANDPMLSSAETQKDQVVKKPTEKQKNLEVKDSNDDEVPDWLKWNFSDKKQSEEKVVSKLQEKKQDNESSAPKSETKEVEKKENSKPKAKQKDIAASVPTQQAPEKVSPHLDIEAETKIQADDTVPDWLKWSFDAPKKDKYAEENSDKKSSSTSALENKGWEKVQVSEKKLEVKNQDKEPTKSEDFSSSPEPKEDVTVPDWLKWSFDAPKEDEKSDKDAKESLVEINKEDVKDAQDTKKDSQSSSKKMAEKKSTGTKVKTSTNKKASPKKQNSKKEETKNSKTWEKEQASESLDKKTEELWDDGMKIPDWLKADENDSK